MVFRKRSDPLGSDPRHGVRGSRSGADPLDSLGLGRVQHLRRLSGDRRQPWDSCPQAAQKFGRPGGGATKSRNIRGANFRRVKRTAEEGRRVVKAEEILAKIERGESVEYENVKIGQELVLLNINFAA